MKRLFFATKIELDDNFTSILQKLKKNTSFDTISWVEKENLHLTLRFLGKTPESKISTLIEQVTLIFQKQSTIELKMNRIAIFGSRYKPTVIWLGFEENDEMKILFEKIEAKVQEVGFEPNQGNFVPHVTIGRIKNILNKKRFSELISQLQPTSSQNLSIHNWSLYQSNLNNKGVEYRIIKDWNREDAY